MRLQPLKVLVKLLLPVDTPLLCLLDPAVDSLCCQVWWCKLVQLATQLEQAVVRLLLAVTQLPKECHAFWRLCQILPDMLAKALHCMLAA